MAVGFLGKLFGGEAGRGGEAVLRAYGKLPMYAEYRRLEVSPGLPTAFSQWMDSGRMAWMQSPTRSPQGVTGSAGLLLRLPDAKELVVARLWDSRDSLGRVFPFSFFVTTPAESLGGSVIERWLAATALFEQFDRLHGELSALGGGGDFYRLFQKRGLAIQIPDLAGRVAAAQRAAEAIDALDWYHGWAPPDQDAGAWTAGLERRCQRWRERPAAVGELALRCPLAASLDAGAQSLTWLRWLEPIVARCGSSASILDSRNAGAAALTVLCRGLQPGDFQFLTSDADAFADQERLSRPPTGASGSGPPPADSLHAWFTGPAPRSA